MRRNAPPHDCRSDRSPCVAEARGSRAPRPSHCRRRRAKTRATDYSFRRRRRWSCCRRDRGTGAAERNARVHRRAPAPLDHPRPANRRLGRTESRTDRRRRGRDIRRRRESTASLPAWPWRERRRANRTSSRACSSLRAAPSTRRGPTAAALPGRFSGTASAAARSAVFRSVPLWPLHHRESRPWLSGRPRCLRPRRRCTRGRLARLAGRFVSSAPFLFTPMLTPTRIAAQSSPG
jgi:hypothetical protein